MGPSSARGLAIDGSCAGPAVRSPWIDTARGLAISLVVLHHVAMGLMSAGLPTWPYPETLASAILSSVRLPVLLFCSGYLIERSLSVGLIRFSGRKLARIGVPYVVWSLAQYALLWTAASWTNIGDRLPSTVWSVIIRPYGPMWFLATLLIAQLLYGALRTVGLRPAVILSVAAAARSLGWEIPPLADSIWRPIDCLAYLALGATIHLGTVGRKTGIEPRSFFEGRKPFALGAIGVLLLAAAAAALPARSNLWTAVVLSPLGIIVSASGSRLLIGTIAGRLLAFIGRHSLEILVAHTAATSAARILLLREAGVDNPAVQLLVGWTAGIAFALLAGALARRMGIGWVFGNFARRSPDTSAGTNSDQKGVELIRAS